MITARILNLRPLMSLVIVVIISGCGQLPASTPTLTGTPSRIPTQTPTMPTTTPTLQPTPLASTLTLGVGSTKIETIYDQTQREAVAKGIPYFFWPDSNIAFVPDGDQYRFFAPNGPRTTITLGTFDDPGAKLLNAKLAIEGIDNVEFPFASGGSIYRDPQSGMLLMFYHAERHFGGDGHIFHSAIGLAVSNNDGKSFQDLGIILESNAKPDVNARCCVDMRGASYMIKDGQFYLYFSDRLENGTDINLTLATAPVAEVVEAAHNGKTSLWSKYYHGSQEAGISGRSSPLESGNPFIVWHSVSYNTYVKKYIMAIAYHPEEDLYASGLYLISSEDGIKWSPRVPLIVNCDCELVYPTIISPDGDPYNTGSQFYIFYTTTPRDIRRYEDTSLQRMTITLTGKMVEAPHAWEFEADGDTEGWRARNQLSALQAADGRLVTHSTGIDPYLSSSWLAIDANQYSTVQMNMKVSAGVEGIAQLFFVTDGDGSYNEAKSLRFPIQTDGEFHTYSLDMSKVPGWRGIINQFRLDPTDTQAAVEIDYIRLQPQ
jgi:hypothetical protein